MAIRRSLFLSFAAAAVAVGGAASPALAQHGASPLPPPPPHEQVADGLMLSADDFELAPGETLLDGGPGVGIDPTYPPEMHDGHQPMFHPGSEMAIGMPCPSCEPGHYAMAEALYMKHSEDRGFINDDAFVFSDDLDYEWAGRLTVGRRFDCVNGYEVVYVGPFEWDRQLDAEYVVGGTTTDLGQSFEAKLNSVELNRTYFGWDVVKATHGIRVMLYEESSLFTRDTAPAPPPFRDDGILGESIDNILIGPQVGLELYYPLGNRFFVGGKLKGAVFANFVDSDMVVQSDAFPAAVRRSSDDVDLAGMFELGTNMGVRITESVTATVGYELWYLMGVASSYDVVPDRFAFREANANDEVLLHGFTAGVHVAF